MKFRENTCSFAGIKPVMADLPYPPVRVERTDPGCAALLSADYCGATSELSAITQYINNENRLSGKNCALARTLLGIAIAEMMHLQKLGELICLLGGTPDYSETACGGRKRMWTPECLVLPDRVEEMLLADLEAERSAIEQYKMHIRAIKDECVNDVLRRIILDEEYHIMLLEALLGEIRQKRRYNS